MVTGKQVDPEVAKAVHRMSREGKTHPEIGEIFGRVRSWAGHVLSKYEEPIPDQVGCAQTSLEAAGVPVSLMRQQCRAMRHRRPCRFRPGLETPDLVLERLLVLFSKHICLFDCLSIRLFVCPLTCLNRRQKHQ